MAEHWTARRERGSRFAVFLIVSIARVLGRRVARLILHPVVIYFLLTAPKARAASMDYLRRVLGREPRWRDRYRHIHYFASATLDRVYMFGNSNEALQRTRHNYQVIMDHRERGGGAILLVAHLGSFEVLRGMGGQRAGVTLRVLMDRATGAKANAIFSAVDATMTERVIDTSGSDVDRILKVKAALDRGEMIGLMADRYQPGERTVDCQFLGGSAPFPLSPWLLAGLTHAPVILAFGLYRGGNCYELHFEQFSERLTLSRANRQSEAREHAQAYAARLEHYARKAPYNWFNFYDFWHK